MNEYHCSISCAVSVQRVRLIYVNLFSVYSAMTEKIVGALKRMKCPHRLEPHQIQGLDFIHIFPVVQVNTERILFSNAFSAFELTFVMFVMPF